MDKQEQRELIGEIKKAYARGDFDRVLMFADEMNIRRLADSRTLEMVADAHAAKGELEDAREVLLMAYEKTPMGRKMAYKLSELSIALDDLDNAVEFYEDFCKMAPHDNDRYLLKYKIGKAGGVSAEDLVKVLAVYCSKEVDEKWMYELAALYYKLRDKEKCLEICDNIILWFANGDYVQKAKALKTRLGAEAETAATPEKENTNAGQLGTDIPLEGYIDMSGQELAQPEGLEEVLEQVVPAGNGPETVAATDDFGMEELNEAFLEEVLQDKTPNQDMAIGDAMAIAEAKEQAEMAQAAEAFERVTRTEVPQERTPSVRKYGRFEGTVTFETVPEKTAEGTPFEVNGEVITLPKTTFEDMSHDWTIPEELLNAEDVAVQPEVFEEPVYGAHRYVPPTEKEEPEFEEPVYGAHRVMTRAEEEAARAAEAAELQAQLEAAKVKAEEEAARAAQLQAELEAAREKIKREETEDNDQPAETIEAPAETETVEAVPEETEPEAALEEPAAVPVEEAVTIPEEAAEVVYDIPEPVAEPKEEVFAEQEEAGLQVSDNPVIAAVIEPVAEPLAEVERARAGFDDVFPSVLNQQEMFPEKERDVLFAGEESDNVSIKTKDEGGASTILFAISPREDESAPDELILPESVHAEVTSSKIAERAAQESREPAEKPSYSSRLQAAIEPEPVPQMKPAVEKPVPTEVIRPTRSSKYSSVSSLFAEDETDNIDGQITLDSMFATYSKRETALEPVIPELPQEHDAIEQTLPEVKAEEEFIVDESAIAKEENEPPLITELGEDFGRKLELEPEMAAEPEADGMSDFEKAMLAYDTARAEGKEGFDFKSLFTKASDEEFAEDSFEEPEEELEEYEEQLYDEPEEEYEDDAYEDEYEDDEYDEEYDDEYEDDAYDEDEYEDDEYDEEYDEDEYEDDAYDEDEYEAEPDEDGAKGGALDDDYEVGFGADDETEYVEEYEAESEDGFEQELDNYEEDGSEEEFTEDYEEEPYEDGDFVEDDYVEEYEEESYEDGYAVDDYEEALQEEEPYEEEPVEYDDSFKEDEVAEEPAETYEEEPYEEAYEEESYEEAPEEYEEAYADEDDAEYEDEYEAEYEDDYEYEDGGYMMPAELKEELAEFMLIDGMEERINRTIGSLIGKKRQGDPTGGNLIVTGDTKSGKTYLTIAVIKAVGQEIGGNSRVAKVKAQALNGKNMMKVFEKIAGSDLLIENVGYLTDETVESLIDILSSRNLSSMVALEGNQLAIDNMISKHPELNELFQTRLNVSELSLAQWADLACQYAEEQGYTVSDMALLALHAKIDELNVPTERLGYDNIRGIIDNAIANASKRGGGKFRFGSKKRKGNAKQLEEADFM